MWALTSFVFAFKSDSVGDFRTYGFSNSAVSYVAKGEFVSIGSETNKLISKFEEAEFSPTVASPITREFFSVKGRIITLGKGNIQVFEYEDTTTLLNEVSTFRESANTRIGSWKKDVHLYKNENLIVFYMGQSKGILESLKNIFGKEVVL